MLLKPEMKYSRPWPWPRGQVRLFSWPRRSSPWPWSRWSSLWPRLSDREALILMFMLDMIFAFLVLQLMPMPCTALLSILQFKRILLTYLLNADGPPLRTRLPLPAKFLCQLLSRQTWILFVAPCADRWKVVKLETRFHVLHKLLENIFCSPATSAPVE